MLKEHSVGAKVRLSLIWQIPSRKAQQYEESQKSRKEMAITMKT